MLSGVLPSISQRFFNTRAVELPTVQIPPPSVPLLLFRTVHPERVITELPAWYIPPPNPEAAVSFDSTTQSVRVVVPMLKRPPPEKAFALSFTLQLVIVTTPASMYTPPPEYPFPDTLLFVTAQSVSVVTERLPSTDRAPPLHAA